MDDGCPAQICPLKFNALHITNRMEDLAVSLYVERPCRLAGSFNYPAIDPLASSSSALDPEVVGEEHYRVAEKTQEILQQYSDLQDIIAILGMDELSEEQQLVVSRARKIQQFLSQSFHVAEKFTGNPGVYVRVEDVERPCRLAGSFNGMGRGVYINGVSAYEDVEYEYLVHRGADIIVDGTFVADGVLVHFGRLRG